MKGLNLRQHPSPLGFLFLFFLAIFTLPLIRLEVACISTVSSTKTNNFFRLIAFRPVNRVLNFFWKVDSRTGLNIVPVLNQERVVLLRHLVPTAACPQQIIFGGCLVQSVAKHVAYHHLLVPLPVAVLQVDSHHLLITLGDIHVVEH